MLKRPLAILSIVLGVVAFLVGCSKDNHETLAFVGDESEMLTCYQIYPEQYFPNGISETIRDGKFPPDLVGQYEMVASFGDGTYEYYNQQSHQYVQLPQGAYTPKSMYIIIEEQVNGMAKIKFAFKRNNDYKDWYEADAYIYGDVFSETNSNDFIICYENSQGTETCRYFRGNIIKGTIGEDGISNIHTWSIIKDREFASLIHGIYNVGGYEHYHADLAVRK